MIDNADNSFSLNYTIIQITNQRAVFELALLHSTMLPKNHSMQLIYSLKKFEFVNISYAQCGL
jgi:hypothetical protein